MVSHAKKPLIPDKPQRNRHVVEAARRDLHDARGAKELMARDTLRVLEYLNAAPLRTLTSQGMRDWVKQQDPPWTNGYWQAIRAQVQEALSEHTATTAPDICSRLLGLIDRLIPECHDVVIGGGDFIVDKRTSEYRKWNDLKSKDDAWRAHDAGMDSRKPSHERLTDAEMAQMQELAKVLPFLTQLNHTAAQGYIKLYAQLTGLTTEKHQHLHLHRAIEQGGDLSEVPESELIAAMRVTNKETP